MPVARFPKLRITKNIESQIKYLLTPKMSDRFIKLFNKGLPVNKIAIGCAVSEQAIRIAFPDLNFGKRKSKKDGGESTK